MLSRNSVKNVASSLKILKNFASPYTQLHNFDSQEEIVENYLDKVMLIGINLPEKNNFLTESALDKLNFSIKKFSAENDFTVAVLHGLGGKFCTGMESSQNASEKGDELIKTLDNLKKPIVGSLQGYIKNFGLQLAAMCDLKVMDETALMGFGNVVERGNVPTEVYNRLASAIGMSRAMKIILLNDTWTANEAKAAGFVNRTVECGTTLGQAIVWAQSIALAPTDVVIKTKLEVLSHFEKINFEHKSKDKPRN